TSSTNGLQFSTQEGTDWKTFGEGFNNRVESIYKRDSVYICIVNGKQFLEISKDYGKTWKEVGIGVSDPFKTLIQDVEYIGGDTLLVASLFGTRISTDFGKTWESFQNEILKSDFVTTNILRLDKNTLLIVASNEGIFKSNNNCRTWEKVPTTFQTLQSTQFNTFEYHNGRVYAFLPSHGLFFSEDRGLSWKEFSKDISEKGSDKGIIFYENYIIISAKDGILITSDDGESSVYHEIEKLANDDTFKTIVNDIAIQGDYLFASSDIGIWRVKLSDLGIVKSTVESQIERNYLYTFPPYPLPAKSEVKVLFYWDINIPMSIDDISIYDLSGQKLATCGQLRLVKNTNHNGNLIWDCSTVPAGIYLINIKHGTESESVKVVVE
ncbi:T9SS type A sorting domain-containing protein, partial [bacterium]